MIKDKKVSMLGGIVFGLSLLLSLTSCDRIIRGGIPVDMDLYFRLQDAAGNNLLLGARQDIQLEITNDQGNPVHVSRLFLPNEKDEGVWVLSFRENRYGFFEINKSPVEHLYKVVLRVSGVSESIELELRYLLNFPRLRTELLEARHKGQVVTPEDRKSFDLYTFRL